MVTVFGYSLLKLILVYYILFHYATAVDIDTTVTLINRICFLWRHHLTYFCCCYPIGPSPPSTFDSLLNTHMAHCLQDKHNILFAFLKTCTYNFFNEFIKFCIFHCHIWYKNKCFQYKIYQKLNLKISFFGKMAKNDQFWA